MLWVYAPSQTKAFLGQACPTFVCGLVVNILHNAVATSYMILVVVIIITNSLESDVPRDLGIDGPRSTQEDDECDVIFQRHNVLPCYARTFELLNF